jgi:CHASE2 domain-containing sensor protein
VTFRLSSTWDADALRKKPAVYWLRIMLLILLGMLAARWLARFDWWRIASYGTYGLLLRASQSAPTHPSWTAVVLIDDEDYWLGEWARRTPLKRVMLANLIRRIHAASPQVIAVDVDLRAQHPRGDVRTHGDYDLETRELFHTIRDVSRTTPIVLPKTIGYDAEVQRFVIDADLFDGVDLGPNVAAGYTRLPGDVRNLALTADVNGRKVDSFAVAVARFVDAKAVNTAQNRGRETLPFSMFLNPRLYQDATVSARDVLNGKGPAVRKLKNKVVVIGGKWHRDAYRRGEITDRHLTPVGHVPGALVHANYIEALLSQRTFSPTYQWVHVGFEFVIGFVLAAIFVAARGRWKIVYIIVTGLFVALMSLSAWQNLGTFFDVVPALVLLAGHALFETVMEWKEGHDQHERCRAALIA